MTLVYSMGAKGYPIRLKGEDAFSPVPLFATEEEVEKLIGQVKVAKVRQSMHTIEYTLPTGDDALTALAREALLALVRDHGYTDESILDLVSKVIDLSEMGYRANG